jgi:acetylornithine deacetylase/succinyl-diaminopimelate desuccinylase-like protein
LTEGFEGRNDYQSHPYTDVYALKRLFNFSCINFAIGYYDYHTKNEYVVIEDVYNGIKTGKEMIESLGNNYYPFIKENDTILG